MFFEGNFHTFEFGGGVAVGAIQALDFHYRPFLFVADRQAEVRVGVRVEEKEKEEKEKEKEGR